MYIYRKRVFYTENGMLSYGYLMDMLWVSCGNGSRMEAEWKQNGSRMEAKW